jgi:hypothetical protein
MPTHLLSNAGFGSGPENPRRAFWPAVPFRSTEFQEDENGAKIVTDNSRCFGLVSYGLRH